VSMRAEVSTVYAVDAHSLAKCQQRVLHPPSTVRLRPGPRYAVAAKQRSPVGFLGGARRRAGLIYVSTSRAELRSF
jgi:hypothetical protein